ncbi:TonB-dependent receptor plug domain-containing protein [Namhaeicola litoreus]|uniref:TonB-dependent receptor plug domain-containing protein n=1 Tax=Namhaeicola litoreus TaxID=1052145 RepID=A0ABW3Y293_9FLAO
MGIYLRCALLCFFVVQFVSGQDLEVQNLNEVLLTSERIEIPFSENSRTIQLITKEDIQKSTASNVAELLQQYAGIDVRRRGVEGTQADLYIRGGSFDQTLVLIDGIKTENPQTGHHTMNMMIPIENIERIEVIKGPAARVYGQNAFTGAINIVTKKQVETSVKGDVGFGSFGQQRYELTGAVNFDNSAHQIHYSNISSDGYRYNTDFKNQNVFLKSKWNTQGIPVDLIATFMERNFGANGFYASPAAKDQYEETQASLIGLSSNFETHNIVLKSKLYWTRGQDMYEFIRDKPEIYRNLHITNKIGGAVDASYRSNLGITGIGLDLARVSIASNNLGDHDRTMVTGFLEHRFHFFDDKFDVTPGIAATYFSDFGFHAFPGIDLGYEIKANFKIYANMGSTYRIPTYTDLYYTSPTTIGNEELEPESALTEELGLKWNSGRFYIDFAAFYRSADNLIDYVKENEDDPWQSQNIQNVSTLGLESTVDYRFSLLKYPQLIRIGYAYLEDDIKNSDFNFSQYSLNSMKHQVNLSLESQLINWLQQSIAFRFVERPDGTNYKVVDAKLTGSIRGFEISAAFNNIFSEAYTETNLVPMPEFNFLAGLSYVFK